MSENEFMQKINDILGQETPKEVRKSSEQYLNEYKQQNPDNFIYAMINLLKNYQLQNNLRSFCAVQLRKNLSVYSEKNFVNLWPKLQPDTQTYVKQNLFICLEQETVNDIRHKIADAIGEVGGTLIEDMQNNQWPELVNLIWALLANNQNKLIEAGLRVLCSIFTFASETFIQYKNELHQIFANAIVSQDNDIKLGGILALASFLEIIEPSNCKQYEDLIPQLLEQTYLLLISAQNVDKGEEALSAISDIAEAEPKFWKKNFNILFEAMNKITFEKQIEDHGIKRISTEVVICVGERLPAVFKKSGQGLLSRLIEMVFSHMVDIEQEVDPAWEKPIEGFNEDVEEDDELEIVRYGTNAIDRLISSIGEKDMLPVLSQVVQQMFQQNDWRYKHAAIMALSQVGEYIDEIKEIEPIILLVCGYANDPNPKIRFAVCHCIGQIADDMQDEFQTNYHQSVMQILLQLLGDSVPRVVSHAAAAITNFVESMSQELLRPYLPQILQMNFKLLENSISIVKESCIAAIAATAEAAKEDFRQFFPEAAPFLFQMMQTHIAKEYKQLRGQIIECLTLVAHGVGYEMFKQYAPTLIQMMLEIQNSNLELIDPQKTYLLSGWQRLCLVMGQEFVQYLPTIIPSIFQLIQKVFDESALNEDEEKMMDINTNQTEESEVAINMLNVIIDEMKGEFLPYAEQTTQLLLPLLQFNTNENIRQAAAKCLPKIITAVKEKDINSAFNVAKVFLGSLWNAVSTEYSATLIIDQVHAMRDCVDEIEQSFLNPQEVDELQKKIVQLLMESDKRKQENAEFQGQEDIEDEEKELINEENDTEEDLHIAIAQLIGTLFKTHREKCLPMVDVICSQILPKVLSNTVSDKMHQFGLFLIDDLIEYIGIELLADKWQAFAEALLQFITDNKCFVRQAAAFGIGILAIKSNQNFQVISQVCVNKIYDALKIAQGDDKQKSFMHARDNIVAALGKIIKYQHNTINLQEVISVWFSYLPLKHDKPEAIQQHDLLCDIIIQNLQMIQGDNGQNLPKIIKIFSEIIDTKYSNASIKQKIVQAMQMFKDNPIVIQHWQDIVQSLDPQQKAKIDSCFKQDGAQQ